MTGCTIVDILPSDNPNEGRIKINENFKCLENNISSSISGATTATTVVNEGTNIDVQFQDVFGVPNYTVNLEDDINLNSVSANSYFVGTTPIEEYLPNTYVTGGTYISSASTINLDRNDGGTVEVSGISFNSEETYWTSGSTSNYSIKAKNDSGLDATGNYSVAQNFNTLASGPNSHAEGYNTTSEGLSSHAEGSGTISSGNSSHAEGRSTNAFGSFSHAEGYQTVASGDYSHAQGDGTISSGNSSHAEGRSTSANGDFSHAEGSDTVASGNSSHAEGVGTNANGDFSHAEGSETVASGDSSHAEGGSTNANGNFSHAEGSETVASGNSSHAEGVGTNANGDFSHAEGNGTNASGNSSHAEGTETVASGNSSHAEGSNTTANGELSHAEGFRTTASGDFSHSEGADTTSFGSFSHAEGQETIATGLTSHAEGYQTVASGDYSHAEGSETVASGNSSHAEGSNTFANGNSSHVGGEGSGANDKVYTNGIASFAHQKVTKSQGLLGAYSDYSAVLGGVDNNVGLNSESSAILGGEENSIDGALRSIILGGSGISATENDTVYVPFLNINSLGAGVAINGLGIDSNGNVVSGVSTSDSFVTGQTFDSNTNILTTNLNNGSTFNSNLSSLASDVYVVSGVYDNISGIVTYTNSTGGTFDVSGFVTGLTTYWSGDTNGIYYDSDVSIGGDLTISGVTTGDTLDEVLVIDSNGLVKKITSPSLIPVSKYASDVSFTGGTTQTITHNLDDIDIIVQLKDSTGQLIIPDIVNNYTNNTVDINVSSTDIYRVIIKS
jgi:hypothetical protein